MEEFEKRSEAELLVPALAGDEHAFRLLYDRLKTGIFRYAYYMTGSSTVAEEVTQEVFITLLKHGKRYNPSQGDLGAFTFQCEHLGAGRFPIHRSQRLQGRGRKGTVHDQDTGPTAATCSVDSKLRELSRHGEVGPAPANDLDSIENSPRLGGYSTFARAWLSPTMSAPISLPSVPLFL